MLLCNVYCYMTLSLLGPLSHIFITYVLNLACGLKLLPLNDQPIRKSQRHLATSRNTPMWMLSTNTNVDPGLHRLLWKRDCVAVGYGCYGNRIEGVGTEVIKLGMTRTDIFYIKPGTFFKLDVLGIFVTFSLRIISLSLSCCAEVLVNVL